MKSHLTYLFLAALIFAGCKKDEDSSLPADFYLIKDATVYNGYDTNYYHFQYQADGKISTLTTKNKFETFISKYSYTGANTNVQVYTQDTIHEAYSYTTNSRGLALLNNFFYDNNDLLKYVVNRREIKDMGVVIGYSYDTTWYHYNQGNLIATSNTKILSNSNNIISYSYDSQRATQQGDIFNFYSLIKGYTNVKNVHLQTSAGSGNVEKYLYEFDNYGRIITVKFQSTLPGNAKRVYQYTY